MKPHLHLPDQVQGQVARLANPDARSCARSWAVDQGIGAHQQSWEPPGSSCCLSLLAGGFRPTTHSGTPGGTIFIDYINFRCRDVEGGSNNVRGAVCSAQAEV
jgi:hypothetical protein